MKNSYRIPSSWNTLVFFTVLLGTLSANQSALAHECDTNQLHLIVGEACLWKIKADRVETTTLYIPTLTGTPEAAGISPSISFMAHDGDFVIRGLAPGTNHLSVDWSYVPTMAAGVCNVTIIVTAPAPGQTSFQTRQGNGQLSTFEFGGFIEARTLRGLLDHYLPPQTLKLLVLTECYGGNVAQSPFFRDMTNTAIASGTSANQEGRTGGYPDDAARTLKPAAGATAADVHQAGTIGRQTVEDIDNPQKDKLTSFILSEWPTVSGAVSLANFPLDPVSATGSIESRHVVVYCGNPVDRNVRVETHAGKTIPAANGQKAPFSDAADRDRIKQNFAGEPNTTVTTAGGAPQAADRRLGQNGWDYSGTLDGLEAAIRKAGDAIKNSAHPEREQFILYVGDHGMMGTLGNNQAPPQKSTPNSRSQLAPSFQSFASDAPAVYFMEQDPNNIPGFLLFCEVPNQNAGLAIPNFQPGQLAFQPGELALEISSSKGEKVLLHEFIGGLADIAQDNLLSPSEGEGVSLFFPVNEQDFFRAFVDRQLDIALINNSQQTFTVAKVEQVTGSIEPGWTPVPRPKLIGPIASAQNGFQLTLRGTRGRTYIIESSMDLRTWRTLTIVNLDIETKAFTDPAPAKAMFYRAQLLD